MKRLAWTVGALLLAGLLLVAGAALPVEQPVATEIPVSGRVTAMCPAFTGATASTVVAAAGTGVDTATLAQPSDRSAVTGLATLNSSDAAVRVVTTWGQAGGGATGLTSESGPERGLSLSGCLEPAAQWWFAGVTSNAGLYVRTSAGAVSLPNPLRISSGSRCSIGIPLPSASFTSIVE